VIDLTPILGLGLLLMRPGALLLASPAFGGLYAPAQVKVGLTFFLALAMLPTTAVPVAGSVAGLTGIIARELAIGFSMALAIRVMIGAAEFGGNLASFQMGLSYAAIVDPASGVRNNVLAMLYANVALVTFLLTNAHHAFLRALRDSYVSMPMGSGAIGASVPAAVTALLGLVFTVGVRLAAPLVVVLLIAELALALVSRSAPALNLMVVSGPVRLLIGLLLLGVVAPAVVGVISAMSQTALEAGVRTAEAFR
jgi:flagellar biosynthetic protein FliR